MDDKHMMYLNIWYWKAFHLSHSDKEVKPLYFLKKEKYLIDPWGGNELC